MPYKAVLYQTASGNIPLKKFIKKISEKKGAREPAQINRYIQNLSEYGFDINKHQPQSIKHIRDQIYELRPGNNRILFFFFKNNQEFVLLHGFVKQTNTTPESEIQKAIKEYNDYIRRMT